MIVLSSEALTVVIAHDTGMPEILSIGPALPVDTVTDAWTQPIAAGTLDVAPGLTLVTEAATGFVGRPGIRGARPNGSGWSPLFVGAAPTLAGRTTATFSLVDEIAELELELRLHVDEVLTMSATLTNHGSDDYMIERLALSVRLPDHATDLLTFGGRWCREFQPQRSTLVGTTAVENRTGRTSHAQMPAMFAGSTGFGEQHGEVWGVQLAWSGNYEIIAQQLPDGRRHIQAGELLDPYEIVLAPGDAYVTPDVVVAWSGEGLTRASQRFHQSVRRHLPSTGARPVILNTWEAVYFDHDLDTLRRLADVAADVGVERFVLDDGWFGGRRDDTAGLGDWWVSDVAWPNGLSPLIDHVTGHGMEFGLWVEPEMVNPVSDLFREHPDWTLTTDGYEPILGRHQLVLDVGRPEVRDHLFDALDALLREYDIAYLKWDMNRDIVQGSSGGRAGIHGHVIGVYDLIDRLRVAHPGVEIESCASGGGRVDLGILRRTDRVWTSDCNDAIERQLIQRGFSMLFPPEVMGAHIGPPRAHTTRRQHGLGFRTATALFGHLGVEWNLLTATARERERVAAAIALHQRLRPLLHSGDVVRCDHPDPAAITHGVVSADRSHAVYAYVQVSPSGTTTPAPLRMPGLDPDARYRLTWLDELRSTKRFERGADTRLVDAAVVPGLQLITRGLQMPVQHPESIVLVELRRVS